MPKHAININERTRDVITFLNDGVPPRPDEDNHYLICEFNGPREITSKIMHEDELYDKDGLAKEYMHFIM